MSKMVTVRYKTYKRDKLGFPEFTGYKVDSGVYVAETENMVELRTSDNRQIIVHKSLIIETQEQTKINSLIWNK